jgi:predicted ArsR family transcriptional regulator
MTVDQLAQALDVTWTAVRTQLATLERCCFEIVRESGAPTEALGLTQDDA